jgi:hypothetical protein
VRHAINLLLLAIGWFLMGISSRSMGVRRRQTGIKSRATYAGTFLMPVKLGPAYDGNGLMRSKPRLTTAGIALTACP